MSSYSGRITHPSTKGVPTELADDNWTPVSVSMPKCNLNPDTLGKLVLIWPRNPDCVIDTDGFAYYGCRHTDEPNFYMYGRVISGVTHWQDLPEGPVA